MDLFGKALLQFHAGQSEAPLQVRRDDGWEDAHSPGIYFEDEPFAFEKPALALIDGPTVDVGCGGGRHLRWLAAQGFDAFGLDHSPGAIEVCKRQGLDNVAECDVLAGPLPDIPFPVRNITLFGNNVGIGGTFDGGIQLLRNLHTISDAGGRLLLTGINVRQTETQEHLAYQAANLANGKRRGELRIRLIYDGEEGAEFAWYHPEPEEVEEIAAKSGWTVERLEPVGNFFWASLLRG